MAMGRLMAAAVVRCKERMQMGLVEKGNKKEGSGDYLGLAHIADCAVVVDVAVRPKPETRTHSGQSRWGRGRGSFR